MMKETDYLMAAGSVVFLGWLLKKLLEDKKYFKCPRCNYPVDGRIYQCPNCGQPLKWGNIYG